MRCVEIEKIYESLLLTLFEPSESILVNAAAEAEALFPPPADLNCQAINATTGSFSKLQNGNKVG